MTRCKHSRYFRPFAYCPIHDNPSAATHSCNFARCKDCGRDIGHEEDCYGGGNQANFDHPEWEFVICQDCEDAIKEKVEGILREERERQSQALVDNRSWSI